MPLPTINHNPIWRCVTPRGIRRVYACDDTQAAVWVRRHLGLAVIRVLLEGRAQDQD